MEYEIILYIAKNPSKAMPEFKCVGLMDGPCINLLHKYDTISHLSIIWSTF